MKNNGFLNRDLPYTIHIDLNSCFAIIEQQANRLLRGRPVGVAAYDTPRGFVLAASYEAKARGVKLGVNVEQSRALAPGIIIVTPDPAKYREAHKRFKALLLEYTPDVNPKSIDEFVLDMSNSPALRNTKYVIRNTGATNERDIHNQAMQQVAQEIKDKIRQRLGEWVTVNIGISTNRFLAKYAAGFGKPDGMLLIDHTNAQKWYRCGVLHDCLTDPDACKPMNLVDLPGINVRFRKRLREAGIYTPTDFFNADLNTLKKRVFKSINGYHWYRRLRGYEADAVEFSRKSIGHQYALKDKTTDIEKLERLLIKLCEKTGRRLRKNNYYATGIHLYLGFDQYRDGYGPDGAYVERNHNFEKRSQDSNSVDEAGGFNLHKFRRWHHGEKVHHRLYSTQDIYQAAKKLLHQAEIPNRVKIMSVHVYGLEEWDPVQLSLFDVQTEQPAAEKWQTKKTQIWQTPFRAQETNKRISDAVDAINNRYGEFVLTPAMMLDMQGTILDRVAFGQVRDV